MKIGRNALCPCGSGKKYKQCCLKVESLSKYDLIKKIVFEQKYDNRLADFLCSMLRYMEEKQWLGACHATCSVMFVALSEFGYNVELCLGEVESENFCFDHSWILLDKKIIDLAASMTLMGGLPVSNPIVLDKDIRSNSEYRLKYGIYRSGLDKEAMLIKEIPFVKYMDSYPEVKNGLWGVLETVFPGQLDIQNLREKYDKVNRQYICNKEVS